MFGAFQGKGCGVSQEMLAGFDEAATASKVCSKCDQLLPLEMFHAKSCAKDGRCGHCRDCERQRTLGKRRVIEGIAHELLCTRCNQVKPQGEFQPSRITSPRSGMCKDCTKERGTLINARQHEKRQRRIDAGEIQQCRVCRSRKPVKDFPLDGQRCHACVTRNTNCKLKNRLRNASNRARDRGLSFDLTLEDYAILVSTPCTYCGGPLPATGSGLDRIENDKGYSSFNCVPCCDACNTARGDRWSVLQMVQFIGPAIRHAREFGGEVGRKPNNRTPNRVKPTPKREAWTAERFVANFLTSEPKPRAEVLTAASAAGIGKNTTRDLLIAVVSTGLAFVWWPSSGQRVKHFANQPCDDSHEDFCESGPGEKRTRKLERVTIG